MILIGATFSGCTLILPTRQVLKRAEIVDPYTFVAPGTEVDVRLRNQDSVQGTYTDVRETPDSDYEARYRAAVTEDSTLGVVPLPGDNLSVTVGRTRTSVHTGTFVAVGDAAWPGLYVNLGEPSPRLLSFTGITSVRTHDGTTVDLAGLRRSALAGRIPTSRGLIARIVTVSTAGGTVVLDARDIDQIAIKPERRVGKALLLGAALDLATLALGAAAFAASFESGPVLAR